ncbi:ABC transporter permease subunit [Streptomyces sp. 3MP-14]|uniref:ABC transporter permease subunit n=1 Tax=Streptomyces mimosae TaxID=2586635 RepID=A0A5N6ARV6_9ACTN|nr:MULTISPECIES: sugar ABC transporter permease [Streptomyces]KAB8170905.1 ABC transporter permease subunit [Streptomyces mimosae]KAB8179744.1 ABC transporter permease subunit [Streptomyces sp. 3MP-14]
MASAAPTVPGAASKDGPARVDNPTPGWRRRETRAALVFVAPALLGFLVFFAWPTVRGLYLSLTDYDLLTPAEFSGLDNYRRLLDDDVFWNSLWVTLQYVLINIGVQTVAALLLAVLIHRLTRSVVLRGIILLPYLISNVVVALLWYWMADYNLGIINEMLGWVGFDPVAFFGDESWAIPSIALVNVWRHLGYTALLIFAGLQFINRDVYEAAAVDGAGEVRIFFRITLPLLRPVMALVLVLTVIGSWQIFDTVAVTTQGGPVDATRVVQYYIYDQAFNRFDFGYASAISVVLFLILAGVALAQLKLLRAGESDQA